MEIIIPYLAYEQKNGYLLPPYLEELIPVDHGARVVNEVVNLLDIREITYQVKIEGCPAYHARIMLKILCKERQKSLWEVQGDRRASFWTGESQFGICTVSPQGVEEDIW